MADDSKLSWTAVERGLVPVWVKIPYTFFLCMLVPVYWIERGPANFLWFSDIALVGTLVAIWLESRLLASMMAVAVMVPLLGWNVDFFIRLIGASEMSDLSRTGYMFDPNLPSLVRSLSLFHTVLPFLLVWLVSRLGYDSRAWAAQTLLAWIVFPVSYLLTDPSRNINWVYGFGDTSHIWVSGPMHVALLMLTVPLVFYLPAHLVLQRWFGRP